MKLTPKNADYEDSRPPTEAPLEPTPAIQRRMDARKAEMEQQRRREAAERGTRSDRTDGQADILTTEKKRYRGWATRDEVLAEMDIHSTVYLFHRDPL